MLTFARLLDTGPPLKLSERVSRLTSLAVAPIEQLLTGLNLGVQQGLDPDPDNLVAVGTFAYGSLASPMQVSTQLCVLFFAFVRSTLCSRANRISID